jgi:ABC-type glycerol-3-phosphate transport system permease component
MSSAASPGSPAITIDRTFGDILQRKRIKAGTIVQYGILSLLLFLSAVPIVLMLTMSVRNSVLIYADFWGLPWPLYLQNYSSALVLLVAPLARTLSAYVVSMAGILVFGTVAAYVFARLQFPGRALLFHLVLVIMMIPGTILLTPQFILANQLGLRDSLFGLMVFYIAGGQPFAIFLLRAFFQSQPGEMFEAARVDGASELRSLWSIAIPLAWPIIITLAILNFTSIYNDLIWPMLMLTTPSKQTLILALQAYNPGGGADVISALPDIGGQAAGYTFASLPQLIVFIFGMRYFIQGLTSGALKA